MHLSPGCCRRFPAASLYIITVIFLCSLTPVLNESFKLEGSNGTETTPSTNPVISVDTTETTGKTEERKLETKPALNQGRPEEFQTRAFRSSENVWKSASKILSRGLRIFRESLLEGAKVAHMFKEDLDEGMSTIMRQNRGVKVDHSQKGDSANSGSFFDSQMLREGVLGGVLRFMGINSKQMGVIALNCLIILAEWITSSMIGKNEVAGVTSRMIKSNLLEWANTGHNSQMEKLLIQARSHSLPEKLIDSLSDKTGNTTSCVQLLICKMTPVIWGLQDTVKDRLNYSDQQPNAIKTASRTVNENDADNGQRSTRESGFLATSQQLFDKFMDHLPEKERIIDFGNRCETKFPHCQLLKFNSL